MGYKDPFAADQPLFSITSANAAQYSEHLSPGQLAMLKRYPSSWKLQVYPTRRSASYPDKVYAAVKDNASSAKLIANGNGIADFKTATPSRCRNQASKCCGTTWCATAATA